MTFASESTASFGRRGVSVVFASTLEGLAESLLAVSLLAVSLLAVSLLAVSLSTGREELATAAPARGRDTEDLAGCPSLACLSLRSNSCLCVSRLNLVEIPVEFIYAIQ